jgi:hypothetical protein
MHNNLKEIRMTTLTKEQIKANTAAVKRLNRNGCYLFKIKDTDQLFYRPASDEAKKLTVISVAVLKRMFGGYRQNQHFDEMGMIEI